MDLEPTDIDRTNPRAWRIRDIVYIYILLNIIIVAIFLLKVMAFGESAEGASENPLLLLAENIITSGLIAALPLYCVIKIYRSDIKAMGIRFARPGRKILIAIPVAFLLLAGATIVEHIQEPLFGLAPVHPNMVLFEGLEGLAGKAVIIFSLVVLFPISEEIFFRGFVYTILRKRLGVGTAVIISSLFFAHTHFYLSWLLPITVIGVGLALLYECTGSIITSIAAHVTVNANSTLLFILGVNGGQGG